MSYSCDMRTHALDMVSEDIKKTAVAQILGVAAIFNDWLEKRLCPLLNENCVVIRDYEYDKLRVSLKSWGITPEIPPRDNRREKPFCDQIVYRWCRRVENMFQKKIKESR